MALVSYLTERDQHIIDEEDIPIVNKKINKWNWGWLQHKHSIKVKRGDQLVNFQFELKDVFRKIRGIGKAHCMTCNKVVNYAARGTFDAPTASRNEEDSAKNLRNFYETGVFETVDCTVH